MTINFGSIVYCKVKSVKTEYDDLTMSLSGQILASLNADQLPSRSGYLVTDTENLVNV